MAVPRGDHRSRHISIIHEPKINTQSGAALVTTLALLVLLLGLTIALFLSASTERRAASLYETLRGFANSPTPRSTSFRPRSRTPHRAPPSARLGLPSPA